MSPTASQTLAPKKKILTVAATVAADLRRGILAGEFPPGTQLRQDMLANQFGVSRIPVREALLQLEAEGLVRITPHKGAVVPEISTHEIEELFQLRALMEPYLLQHSAQKLTPEDFARLDDIMREYSAELRTDHVERWGELNSELHLLLYSRCDQPRALAFVTKLIQETDRHSRLQLSLSRELERAENEHAQLVDLCRQGNYAQAIRLLKDHIENVGRSLIASLDAGKDA